MDSKISGVRASMQIPFPKKILLFLFVFCGSILVRPPIVLSQEELSSPTVNDFSGDPEYQEDLDFFVEVYKTAQEHYYKPVDPERLRKFIYVFNTQLYPKMKLTHKSNQYIKWRNAAYLVDGLKQEEDIFSSFLPPKDAERYETTVLGKRMDLGIDGEKVGKEYRVTWVEPRSDAYAKGLREQDLLYQIGGKKIAGLTEEEIQELLTPLVDETVVLRYREHGTLKNRKIKVVSKEYFKQLAFLVPTGVESIFCIQIERFNRMTAEDMARFMDEILQYPGETGLIIDLRGNPGGPPLAAREISAFFLSAGEEFAYFQRNRSRSSLDVPEVADKYHYHGDIVILINEKSGSASELFSGILQRKGRAELMGVNSAGQVFLKSMFYLSDNSMVLLVTAQGHHPDGTVFSFDGLTPDIRVDDAQQDLVRYAAKYLLKKREKVSGE